MAKATLNDFDNNGQQIVAIVTREDLQNIVKEFEKNIFATSIICNLPLKVVETVEEDKEEFVELNKSMI